MAACIPGEKLVHFVVGKINYGGLKPTAYTWDWYCLLVDDRASFILLHSKPAFVSHFNLNVIFAYSSRAEAQ